MTANISFPEKPWQNALVGSREKLNTLFYNGNFSDLTITFPGQDIAYKAHRLIMAVSSSIFEGMLYGPMAIQDSELALPDDNPEAFKIVLGSCYEVAIETSDIDVALDVYMLADKYFMGELTKEYAQHIGKLLNHENVNKVLEFATQFNFDSYIMEQLGKECVQHIGKLLNDVNVNKVLEFANHFNFDSLKATCFEVLESLFQTDEFDSTKMLFALQPDRLQELLKSNIDISHLVFQKSWRYPGETLCEDIVMKTLKSNCCSYRGLMLFAGCVSAKVVSNICWREKGSICSSPKGFFNEPKELRLSFTNHQQANEVISVLYDVKYTDDIFIHLQCNMIPANRFMRLPLISNVHQPDLFISNVDNYGIEWVISAACSLKPKDGIFDRIAFPESKLTLRGLKELLTRLASICVEYRHIEVCSSELPSHKENEIQEWVTSNLPEKKDLDKFRRKDLFTYGELTVVELHGRNEDIYGW